MTNLYAVMLNANTWSEAVVAICTTEGRALDIAIDWAEDADSPVAVVRFEDGATPVAREDTVMFRLFPDREARYQM